MKRIVSFLSLVIIVVGCSSGSQNQDKPEAPQPTEQTTTTPTPVAPPVAVEEENEEVDMSKAKMGPMESIKDLDAEVEGYQLGQTLTPEQLEANRKLKQKIIRGTFDIKELSRLALDKHWSKISAEEQKHFVSLMTQLLERKAIFSKEQLQGENKLYQINYLREEIDKTDSNKAVVYTRMIVPKRKMDLELTYKLIKKPAGWKIYDVIVDDAELLKNYRYQFDRIIQKGGYEDLVKRMEQKLNNIGASAPV